MASARAVLLGVSSWSAAATTPVASAVRGPGSAGTIDADSIDAGTTHWRLAPALFAAAATAIAPLAVVALFLN